MYARKLAMSDGSRPFVDRDKDRFQNLNALKYILFPFKGATITLHDTIEQRTAKYS